jgi:hypothetical protein
MSVASTSTALGLLLTLGAGWSAAEPACRDARLTVVWENAEKLGRPLSSHVQREVASIFRGAGVAVDWRERTADDEGGEDLSVTVLARPRSGTLPVRAMGAVNRGSSRVFIFLSGIERLLGHSVAGSAGDVANATRLIGRVVAHEMVHVVAPRLDHTRDGLMQAQWDRAFAFRPRLSIGGEVVSALRAFVCPAPQPSPGTMATLKDDGLEGDYSDDPSSS